jgi:hypothetical protein
MGVSMRFAKIAVCAVLFLLTCSRPLTAQTPNAAANGPNAKSNEGFYPGWNLGVRFEGSTNSDGKVFDLGTGAGYNFSHHFGVGFGVPYYFVGTPSSIQAKNQQAVSGNGFGDVGADLKWLFPSKTLTYASTLHVGAPTGDKKKGFSVGHATWNWSNHIEHGWGNFTPFIDGGLGNTVMDSRHFHRPFMTFGYNAQFEAGMEIDAGPISLSASAYDVAPWGPQTVISRVFRCSSTAKCGAAGKTTNRKGYLQDSVTSGDASLARDSGFNASAEFKPVRALDLEIDYSRSVPLRLNTFSFGIGVDLGALLRRSATGK